MEDLGKAYPLPFIFVIILQFDVVSGCALLVLTIPPLGRRIDTYSLTLTWRKGKLSFFLFSRNRLVVRLTLRYITFLLTFFLAYLQWYYFDYPHNT